jgi:hypothetical protein
MILAKPLIFGPPAITLLFSFVRLSRRDTMQDEILLRCRVSR